MWRAIRCVMRRARTLVAAPQHVEQAAVAHVVAEAGREVAALHVHEAALVEAAAQRGEKKEEAVHTMRSTSGPVSGL